MPRAASRQAGRHGCGIRRGSTCEPSPVLEMTRADLDKGRIALGKPHGKAMPDDPEHEAGDPEAQAERQDGRERADQNGGGARSSDDQDWLGERAVKHELEAVAPHGDSTPPPNEKKERKNEVAANATERPNTTCTILRKPPEVSPNASERPGGSNRFGVVDWPLAGSGRNLRS